MSKQIDDQDGSVVYSKPGIHWSTHGGPSEFASTSSLTRTRGANAKIKFSGSSIGVYGTISPSSIATSDTTSQYIVDGGSPTAYTANPTKDTQYGVRFFQSAPLSPGDHTLEITNESEDGWFWLDYFIVATTGATSRETTTGNSTVTSTASGASTSSTSSSAMPPVFSPPSTGGFNPAGSQPKTITRIVDGAPMGTSPVPDATPSTIESSSATHNSGGPSAGTIIGGIFGGFLGLLVFIAVIWCLRRKLEDKFADEAAAIPSNSPLPPSPNVRSFPPNHTRGSSVATSFDVSGGARQNMSQVHNRHGSNASSVYPFVPGSAVQPRYHQSPAPLNGQARMSTQQYRPPSRADLPPSGLSHGAVNPTYAQAHQRDLSWRYSSGSAFNGMGPAGGSGPSSLSSGQPVYGHHTTNPGPTFHPPPTYSGPPGLVANIVGEKL